MLMINYSVRQGGVVQLGLIHEVINKQIAVIGAVQGKPHSPVNTRKLEVFK